MIDIDYLEFPIGLTNLSLSDNGDAVVPRPVMKISSMIRQARDGQIERNVPAKVTIYLPCPAGIGFSDAATYNDAEMGFLGNAQMQDKIKSLNTTAGSGALEDLAAKAGGVAGGLGIKSMLDSLSREFQGGDAGNSLAVATGGFANALAIARGVTLNKNITTEFTGVGTRQFQFQFKFVPSSLQEAKRIDKIVKYLRRGVYPTPTAGGISLKYPPKYKIEFLSHVEGEHLTSIPRISPCYLENISTTYNGSNAWLEAPNGAPEESAPVETDIQISFKEERALTMNDILKLESGEEFDNQDYADITSAGTAKGGRFGSGNSGSGFPLSSGTPQP